MATLRLTSAPTDVEQVRLEEDARKERNWKRWGPYLAERQWGTVREDYSEDGNCWTYFPHEHARSRAYRWGEDGLFGLTDRECRMCFCLSLWNEQDFILKERLFGLAGPEGNHGEDVKESYYYLDATPTFSYAKALYKYPQAAFPYRDLVEKNQGRSKNEPELELEDLGVFRDGAYFDVFLEYAKAGPNDIHIRVRAVNRGKAAAPLHLLPTFWQRNTWAWGREGEGYFPKGDIRARVNERGQSILDSTHPSLGNFSLACEPLAGARPQLLFTENETNVSRLFKTPNKTPYVKDAFHHHVVDKAQGSVNPAQRGTKAAAWYRTVVPAGGEVVLQLRLAERTLLDASETSDAKAGEDVFAERIKEADAFHHSRRTAPLTEDERRVVRQADAGLLWSRQFYHYVVEHWLEGDPSQPAPPPERKHGRNHAWSSLYARDIISMPDKWEYPWFAAWDLAFQAVAVARIDPAFAKNQILLLGREWYQRPDGQLPAYEFAFGDLNPPVHAWAAWRVYQLAAEHGLGYDRHFLQSAFHKCLMNFMWWVNREDPLGTNLFTGGFLGLDNIGVFDRSRSVPGGGQLEQADATAWMGFYCTSMLAIALELSKDDDSYADIASKFFEHFVSIATAMNAKDANGLWDEEDGFYYDRVILQDRSIPLRIRSAVGLVPLFAAEALDEECLGRLPQFRRRLEWFLDNRPELAKNISLLKVGDGSVQRLLSIPTEERMRRVLSRVLDENEFLSPYGIRSLSRFHEKHPYELEVLGEMHSVRYVPGDSDNGLFGGNSNWRGPVWLPINYLLIEALKRHHHFYGSSFQIECPRGSGRMRTLLDIAEELELRLCRLFLPASNGQRPSLGEDTRYRDDPNFRQLVLFHEYFHGDTGRGLGASHQTGWTALAGNLLERVADVRARDKR